MFSIFFEKRLLFLQAPENNESPTPKKDETPEKKTPTQNPENQNPTQTPENQENRESQESQESTEKKVNGWVKYYRGLLKRTIGDETQSLTVRAGILGLNLLFPYARAIGEAAYVTYKGVGLCLSTPVTSRIKEGSKNFWEAGIVNNAKRIKNVAYALPHAAYTSAGTVVTSATSATLGLGGATAYAGQVATKPLTWVSNIPILRDIPGYKPLLQTPENVMQYMKDKLFTASGNVLDVSKKYASGTLRDVDNTIGNTEGAFLSALETPINTVSGAILGKNDPIAPKVKEIRKKAVEGSFVEKFVKPIDEKNAL